MALYFPILSYRSELWAEQGTNFLANALEKGFWENLLITDAGYIVLLTRLVALIAYYCFPLRLFPYITNIFGLCFVAFSTSFFCLGFFRDIIKSDLMRFILSILLAVGMASVGENYTYVNFVYYGMFFCVFIIFLDKNSLNSIVFWSFSGLTALICISKFHFVLFLPLYLYLTLYSLKKSSKDRYFFLPAIGTILFQIFNVLRTMSSDGLKYTAVAESFRNILLRLYRGILWYIKLFSPNVAPHISCVIFLVFICIACYALHFKWLSRRQILFLLVVNYVACAYTCIACLAYLGSMSLRLLNMGYFRGTFIPCELAFLSISLVFYVCYQHIKNRLVLLSVGAAVMAVYMLNFGVAYMTALPIFYPDMRASASEWRNYHRLLSYPDYFLPVNPEMGLEHIGSWAMRKNCDMLMREDSPSGNTILTPQIYQKRQGIRAVYLEYHNPETLKAEAYDNSDVLLATGKMINYPWKYRKYILFEEKVSPAKLVITTSDGRPVELGTNNPVLILGK